MNNKIYTTISHSEPANAEGESIWSVPLGHVTDACEIKQIKKNGALLTFFFI